MSSRLYYYSKIGLIGLHQFFHFIAVFIVFFSDDDVIFLINI